MVKTYVPQELIDTYNKGRGIDDKEYSFITAKKKLPEWMNIPAHGLSPESMMPPEPAGMPDFSEVAPFNSDSMMTPMGAGMPPMSMPTPPMPPTSVLPPPVVQPQGGLPMPSAITGM